MFTSIVNWFKSFRRSEATEQEIEEYFAREYIKRLERAVDELTIELDYQKYLAKRKIEDEIIDQDQITE